MFLFPGWRDCLCRNRVDAYAAGNGGQQEARIFAFSTWYVFRLMNCSPLRASGWQLRKLYRSNFWLWIYAADATHSFCGPYEHFLDLQFRWPTNRFFPPVAPHSVGCEFLRLLQYRGIVEEAVLDCLGRPIFFDLAVELAMERIQEKIHTEEKT
jgi:hypothetical protein